MAEKKEIKATLRRDKETKRTWRYEQSAEESPVFPTVYLQKSALRELGDPSTIEIVVRAK